MPSSVIGLPISGSFTLASAARIDDSVGNVACVIGPEFTRASTSRPHGLPLRASACYLAGGGGGGGTILAVVLLLALIVVLFLVFGRGLIGGGGTDKIKADVKIDTPATDGN